MTIRKGNLWRICKKCGKSFEPNGKFERYCDNCNPKGFSWINLLAEKQRKKTATPKHKHPYKHRITPTIKEKEKRYNGTNKR